MASTRSVRLKCSAASSDWMGFCCFSFSSCGSKEHAIATKITLLCVAALTPVERSSPIQQAYPFPVLLWQKNQCLWVDMTAVHPQHAMKCGAASPA